MSREWTKREDDLLKHLVETKGTKNWASIVAQLPGRKESTCQRHWNKVLKPSLIKGPWTSDEDARLVQLVHQHGGTKRCWSVTAQEMPGRTSKACRERWHNHLSLMNMNHHHSTASSSNSNSNLVHVNKDNSNSSSWTREEDVAILQHQATLGSHKWSELTKFLPERCVSFELLLV